MGCRLYNDPRDVPKPVDRTDPQPYSGQCPWDPCNTRPMAECQGHSSLDAPSELNPPQRIPSLFETPLVPQAEG